MPDLNSSVTGLPVARRCPFDPPEELAALRARDAITRMRYPDGHDGWLVTGHALARTVLADPRFSARHELRHSPVPTPAKPMAAMPGVFIGMDPPDHTRYRQLINRHFTVRRVRELEPMIERVVARRLDAMAAAGPAADLMRAFALPVPAQIICELLGVPEESHEEIQRHRMATIDPESNPPAAMAATRATMAFMLGLAQRKRAEPGDDLLSGLIADGGLDDQELAGIALLMLIAGHETTANMLGLGVYLLLDRPDLAEGIRGRDGALSETAVDELLRYLAVVQFASRAALTDVELGGVTITAGETVTVSLSAANRDGARFDDPARFRADRPGSGHLSFGHGAHQCLGQHLTRAELRIGLSALLRRFPGLRLDVSPAEIGFREAVPTVGVTRLPVRW